MLSLRNIQFSYQNAGKPFSISIKQADFHTSEITCILGENGSGKTTILNIIGGHLLPTSGSINLNGTDITKLSAEKRPTSTVFQQIGLLPHLNVKQNIELAVEPNYFWKKKEATKLEADKIIANFGLQPIQLRKPGELSIGQQQKVAIARSLSTKPDILLLDEPTSALDYVNIRSLRKMLREICSNGVVPVIVIVSHDLPFVLSVADNIKYVQEGQILFDSSVKEFKSSNYYITEK